MANEMKLPQLGENVDAGVVLSVLVSPGDHVERDQAIMELETDKATTEVPADFSGIIKEIRVEEGDEVEGGQTIVTYEEEEEQDEEQDRDEEEEQDQDKEEEQDQEKEKEQDQDKESDEDEESDEDKADRDKEDQKEKKKAQKKKETKKSKKSKKPERPRPGDPVPASPAIRKFARELGVPIGKVPGTGSGGRILEHDVKNYVRSILEKREEKPDEGPELPDFSQWGDIERQPMTAIRRVVSRNVATAWDQIPHVHQFDKADITDLQRFQERFQDLAADDGGKLTVTSILLKILAEALKTFPEFNSSLDLDRAELIVKDYINIGVAVDTDHGLLVPVLRDVDKKGLAKISSDLISLAKKARARKISRDELQGASFTLTNLGGFGTTYFTPIVGWPQVAILAVGKAEIQPVYQDGEFVPRRILPLGITYDHRAVDGADAARFLRWICETLEEPLRLTMGD